MVWVLLIVTAVLAVLVGALAWRLRRLERRLAALPAVPALIEAPDLGVPAVAAEPVEFVITRVGEPEVEEPAEPAAAVPAPVFADLVLKETVVQTASLVQGLRRALSAESRNRIRFHVRQEVKRSRKQRRTELREIRREWAARQRTSMARDEAAEGNAA